MHGDSMSYQSEVTVEHVGVRTSLLHKFYTEMFIFRLVIMVLSMMAAISAFGSAYYDGGVDMPWGFVLALVCIKICAKVRITSICDKYRLYGGDPIKEDNRLIVWVGYLCVLLTSILWLFITMMWIGTNIH